MRKTFTRLKTSPRPIGAAASHANTTIRLQRPPIMSHSDATLTDGAIIHRFHSLPRNPDTETDSPAAEERAVSKGSDRRALSGTAPWSSVQLPQQPERLGLQRVVIEASGPWILPNHQESCHRQPTFAAQWIRVQILLPCVLLATERFGLCACRRPDHWHIRGAIPVIR